jgi:polygalacturonase
MGFANFVRRLGQLAWLASLFGVSCGPVQNDPAGFVYMCETSKQAAFATAGGEASCGEDDPNLPPEPTFPSQVCRVLEANKSTPDESNLDTARVQAALDECKGKGAVKLVKKGKHDAFITAHLEVDSVVLWVDEGVTLYSSRDPELFQETGNCGVMGVSDSGACLDFLQVRGTNPGIVGDGTIDGQGGEPLVGHDYSWWQLSGALRAVNGSIGNPQLINLERGTTGFVLYRVTLHDAAKFHVKITGSPADGVCDVPGKGFTIWGVTVLTPSKLYNSVGQLLTPHFSRNSDGVDPGTTDVATCGVIACNTISTGDDQIAIKGGHLVKDVIIAHNHFGTGHGMSIGSETYGEVVENDGTVQRGVQNILVYDLTIDADSRAVGYDASDADFNGIRIKSDISRGGLVDNIEYRDICMRDMNFAIVMSSAYNPLFSGDSFPEFGHVEFHDVRHVTCMGMKQPVVTLEGHSRLRRAGPVTMDNVVIDNIGPQAVSGEFIDLELGPGNVNFRPRGLGVKVNDNIESGSQPKRCVFPELPTPEVPEGWLE